MPPTTLPTAVTLLALETATDTCGAAVHQSGRVTAEAHLHRPRVHSAQLTPLIEDVLARADLVPSSLDAVAVSMGPGSYTGLRIGVSTAKGWALATGADLVGVPTLRAYAARLGAVAAPGDVICALLDARRDEVYAGAFRRTDSGLETHAETTALPTDALPEWLGPVEGHLWGVGSGTDKSRSALSAVAADGTILPPDAMPPSAAAVARQGRLRLDAEGPADVRTFEPLYVKEAHATPAPSPFA